MACERTPCWEWSWKQVCQLIFDGGALVWWWLWCWCEPWWCRHVVYVAVSSKGWSRRWMEEKPPPPSCVSSKGVGEWIEEKPPPPSCVSSKGESGPWWCRHVVYSRGSGVADTCMEVAVVERGMVESTRRKWKMKEVPVEYKTKVSN